MLGSHNIESHNKIAILKQCNVYCISSHYACFKKSWLLCSFESMLKWSSEYIFLVCPKIDNRIECSVPWHEYQELSTDWQLTTFQYKYKRVKERKERKKNRITTSDLLSIE